MLRKQGCLFLVYQIFGLKSDLLKMVNWLRLERWQIRESNDFAGTLVLCYFGTCCDLVSSQKLGRPKMVNQIVEANAPAGCPYPVCLCV